MLLSIIIVTYNAEKFIANCIHAIQSKCGSKFEIIIFDGGSNDNTVSVAQNLLKKEFKIFSEKDYGIYDAMNKAIKVATGDFLYFIGSDDEWQLSSTEVVNILRDTNCIYYGNVRIKEKPEKIYGSRFNRYTIINRNICHQAIFFPKAVFTEFAYELKYNYLADYILNIKLWSSGKYLFCYVNKIFAVYSIKGLSSTKIDKEFKKDILKVVYNNYGIVGIILKGLNPVINLFRKKIYEY